MKKFFVGILMFVLSALSFAEAAYHIGVVSGTVSQSEDSLRGAEAIMAKYGAADKGGMVFMLLIQITLCRRWKQQFLKLLHLQMILR